MNTFTLAARHFFIAAAVALCALPSCTAYAADDSKSWMGPFTWNFGFGDHVSYGSNRTKGSGAVKEETRAVAGFTRLVLALPATVALTQGATESLAISADDNLLPLLRTRVENGELAIDADKSRGPGQDRHRRLGRCDARRARKQIGGGAYQRLRRCARQEADRARSRRIDHGLGRRSSARQ